jgi:uncharacterized protein
MSARGAMASAALMILLVCAYPVAGCAKGAGSGPAAPGQKQDQKPVQNPNQPRDEEFRFPKGTIRLGGKTIEVEYANTPALRERGLMFRQNLPEDHGMLFIFAEEQPLAFWMKNTLIPLSIGYFDRNRKLVDVQEMVPAAIGDRLPPSYPSRAPAMFALEMPKGWFKRNKIDLGATFSFVKGP